MARKSKYLSAQPLSETSVHYLAGQYGRLSVEDGDDTESNSIGNQAKIADAFLAECPDIQIVDRYADNGYTGMNYNRPAFHQMMADVRSGKINCIIIKDISRLGRHFVETSELVEQIFPAMNVRLISVNDNYDSLVQDASAAASLTMPLKMVMNENYAKDISRKIRSSIHAQMRSGTYLPSSGSIPYGYLRNAAAASYDIDEETAPVVRRIFTLRAEGVSFNAIAKQLNQEHIPSPAQLRYLRGMNSSAAYRDALWSRATIRKIVGSDVYIGNRTYGKVSRNHLNEKRSVSPRSNGRSFQTHIRRSSARNCLTRYNRSITRFVRPAPHIAHVPILAMCRPIFFVVSCSVRSAAVPWGLARAAPGTAHTPPAGCSMTATATATPRTPSVPATTSATNDCLPLSPMP